MNDRITAEEVISQGSARFHSILQEMGQLHDQKQRDYGLPLDPFSNVRASIEWGVPSWVGCMVRATDKLRRLQTFAKTGTLANESVRDSFLDLAVYSIIGLCLFDEASALEEKAIIDSLEESALEEKAIRDSLSQKK